MRLLKKPDRDEAKKLTWLRKAYEEGLSSGPAEPLDMAALKAEAQRRLHVIMA